MLFYELIDCVDKGFYRSCDNIGVGSKAIVVVSIVFHLHVYLTHVVATFINSLNEKLLDGHRSMDNRFDRFDSSVYRTVTGSGCLEFFACDVQTHAGNRL